MWQNEQTNKLLVQRKSQVCAQIIYKKNIFGHCMISVPGIDHSISERGVARNRLEPRPPYLWVTINQFLNDWFSLKRELNIFHTESYTDFEKNENYELFCPKNSVKSCAQINRFERSYIYSYLQRDLHSWTEENVIIMWNRLLNTAKNKLLTQKRKDRIW